MLKYASNLPTWGIKVDTRREDQSCLSVILRRVGGPRTESAEFCRARKFACAALIQSPNGHGVSPADKDFQPP